MKVQLIKFGVLEGIIKEKTLNLSPGTNTEQVKNQIKEHYPELRTLQIMVFVNNKQIATGTLSDGDQVALIPPFAGG